jgi:hypothetical protein
LPILAWRDLEWRQVDHALEHFADHDQMGAMAGILLLEVGEIGVGDVEPLRQRAREQQRSSSRQARL